MTVSDSEEVTNPLLGPEIRYKAYPYRWFQLFLYCLLNVANAFTWITFTTISDKAQTYWDVSIFWIDALSEVFFIAFLICIIPGTWMIQRWGLRFAILAGAIFTLVGCAVRILGKWSFYLCLLGQSLAAIAQPFIINTPTLLAANWFPAHQRTLATTIASISNPIGVAIGFVVPPPLVNVPSDMVTMLIVETGVVALCLLPVIIFFRGKPPTPPSGAAQSIREENFLRSLKLVCLDWNFWLLFLQMSFGLGAFNSLATVVNQLVQPYGYSNFESGILGALVIFWGVVGSAIVGILVDKTHRYKFFLILCLGLGALAGCGMALSLRPNMFWLLAIAGSLVGLTITPTLPIAMELSCEIVYPVQEFVPTGILMASGQLTGLGMITGLTTLITKGYPQWAAWSVAMCFGIAMLLMLPFQGKLKRLNSEATKVSVQE